MIYAKNQTSLVLLLLDLKIDVKSYNDIIFSTDLNHSNIIILYQLLCLPAHTRTSSVPVKPLT